MMLLENPEFLPDLPILDLQLFYLDVSQLQLAVYLYGFFFEAEAHILQGSDLLEVLVLSARHFYAQLVVPV